MRPFNLTNLDQFNLELVIGATTYTDEFFELQGTQSVSFKGDATDFANIQNANKVIVNIIADATTHPYLELFAKHPVKYDGKRITVQLDTIPAAKFLSYTTTKGYALPYAFGKPYVKPVLVSEVETGVVTAEQYSLSISNLHTIFDSYLSAHVAIAEASVAGLGDSNKDGLQSVMNFYAIIRGFQESVPQQYANLELLYPLVSWRGTSSNNKGMPPPLSLYSIRQNQAYSPNRDIDSFRGVNGLSQVYRNMQTGEVATLITLQAAYRNLCNSLLVVPTTLEIDLGNNPQTAITLLIDGLYVTGDYAAGILTITDRTAEVVSWTFTPHIDHHSILVDTDLSQRDLVGKFVKVQVQSSYPYPPTTSYVGSLEVLKQVGNVLVLDSLPFEEKAKYNDDGTGGFYNSGTRASGLMRSGVILNISDTLEGSRFEGDPFLVHGNYGWDWSSTVQVPVYYGSTEGDADETLWEMAYYSEYIHDIGSVEDALDRFEASGIKTNYATAFQGDGYVWGIATGERIEYADQEYDIYIADFRPSMTIIEIKSKVGDHYVVVPPEFYEIFDYEIEGHTCTAIKILVDLESRDLSNELTVQVDSTEYTVDAILDPLATLIGKTYVGDINFVASPNFAVYGNTLALDVIKDVTEQSSGGYLLSYDELRSKYLAGGAESSVHSFDYSNIKSFNLTTADTLKLVNNTEFSWESLRALDEPIIIALANPPDTVNKNTKVKVTIFDDEAQVRIYGEWYVHRNGKAWNIITVKAFTTALHIERLDTVYLPDLGQLGEVQSASFTDGIATIEILLGDALWTPTI